MPKLPSEGGQRAKKCRADILQVAKVEEHIRRALQLLGHYAPISISRQNRELDKVLHRDCKAKRKLENSVIAKEIKPKIVQSIFFSMTNLPIFRQTNLWIMICLCVCYCRNHMLLHEHSTLFTRWPSLSLLSKCLFREGGRDSWLRNMTMQNAWLRKVDVTLQMKVFVRTYFEILFLIGPNIRAT